MPPPPLEAAYDINIPRDPGQDTYASMLAADRGEVQASVLLGGNLFASNPDRAWAGAALRKIRAGNLAMYYPEANVLVPRRLDERSKTPAFKSVLARVERVG